MDERAPKLDNSRQSTSGDSFGRRAVAGLSLTLGLVLLISLGGWFLLFAVDLIVGLGTYEMLSVLRSRGSRVNIPIGVLLSLGVSWGFFWGGERVLIPLLMVLMLGLLSYELFSGSILTNVPSMLFAVLYVGLLGSSPLLIYRFPPEGFRTSTTGLILIVFLAVWALDTVAYLVGRRYGRHKLWPRISPGKTVEGSVAGLIGALFVVSLCHFWGKLSVAEAVGIGLIVGVVGQVGDLVESLMKREAGVKDSSHLIPGHGGVLDRFDSAFFVFPAVYMYLKIWH
ncbi:MAG: phosphatidate cytidylyltransferase [Candidatus Latescibacteria bacterium]|nr:phosphatidate cytidylyltransferase [Candidatus Latescibacterota bacterium]